MVFTRSMKFLVILGCLATIAMLIGDDRLASYTGLSRESIHSIVAPVVVFVAIFGCVAFLAMIRRLRT